MTRGRSTLLAALVAAAVLVAGACSSAGGRAASASVDPFDIAPGDGVVSRMLAGTLSLEISGAIEGRWEGATPIQALTMVGGQLDESSWLLTLGLLDPVELDGGRKVRPAFDLVGYRGDGTYEILPHGSAAIGGDPDNLAAGAVESDASLVTAIGDDEPVRLNELLEPCTLEVRDRGEEGSISCPRVRMGDGEIAYRWSWEAHELLSQQDQHGGTGGAPADASPATTSTTAPGGDSAGPPPAADPGAEGGGEPASAPLAFEVTMSATCLNRGMPVTITVVTEPRAAVAMAMAFSDARTYGLQKLGTAGDDGRFVWQVVVPPEAPDGEGHLLASASSEDGERASKHIEPFEVRLTPC